MLQGFFKVCVRVCDSCVELPGMAFVFDLNSKNIRKDRCWCLVPPTAEVRRGKESKTKLNGQSSPGK